MLRKERHSVLGSHHLNQERGKQWFWEPLFNYTCEYSGPLYRVMYSSHMTYEHLLYTIFSSSEHYLYNAQNNLSCCDVVCTVLVTATKVYWCSVQRILLNVFQSMIKLMGVEVKWQTLVCGTEEKGCGFQT